MRNKMTKISVAVSVSIGLLAGTAHASVLEEVVVTAQKREQSLQDVGIAVTAITGDQIEALGYTHAQQVTAQAPGVQTVQPNGEANYSIGIRGVTNSDFTTNVESPVAVYVDEVYISQSSGTGFALFDLERVEILRGPQGTLFGRNATGGLGHFITKKPTQETEGYAKVTIGDYDQYKLEGAVSGGLTDNLSARLSVQTHDNDGYIDNRFTGETLNNANDVSGRLQLMYTPSDDLEVLFSLRRSDQDIRTGFFEHAATADGVLLPNGSANPILGYADTDGDVFAGDYDTPGFNDLETEGYSATVKWALNDSMNLTSITDYSTVERNYIEDSDATPLQVFQFFLTTDAEQFSQELRIDGETDKLKWVAGLYYLDLDINDSNGGITDPFGDFFSDVFFGASGAPVAPGSLSGINNPYTSELESTSVFGQVEYALSDKLRLTAGLRFISDDKDFAYKTDIVDFLNPASAPGFNAASNVVVTNNIGTYRSSRSDDEIAGRLQLDWDVSDTTLAYASYNRGVRGGGFNAPIFPVGAYDDATLSFDPEQLDALEVGFKTDIGSIGRLNAAAYYYDYKDYQIFNIVGIDTITINSPDAEAKGFELELQLSPGEGWDIILGAAYNDTDVILGDGVTERRPIQSPEVDFNGLVRYSFPAFGGDIAVQADASYRDDVIFALTATPSVSQDSYTVANISTSYTKENWQFSAFVHNVNDEEYLVQTFDLGADLGLTEQYYGRPRWWGVSARYEWGQ